MASGSKNPSPSPIKPWTPQVRRCSSHQARPEGLGRNDVTLPAWVVRTVSCGYTIFSLPLWAPGPGLLHLPRAPHLRDQRGWATCPQVTQCPEHSRPRQSVGAACTSPEMFLSGGRELLSVSSVLLFEFSTHSVCHQGAGKVKHSGRCQEYNSAAEQHICMLEAPGSTPKQSSGICVCLSVLEINSK